MAKRRIEISAEDMRRIARYEITFRDLVPEGNFMGVEFVCAGRYETTLEDLREALARMRESDPPLWELYSDWFGPLQRLADNFGLNRFDDDEKNDAETSEFPGLKTTEGEYFSDLLQALRYACEGFEDDEEEDDEEEDEDEGWRLSQELNLNARINQIDRFLENRSKPLDEWRFSRDEKERYVRQFESDAFQAKASEPALALARKFVEELCEEDSTLALHIKGYSCYGGNRLYPTDWRASRDCITRLFEKTNDPGYANTLGYIYYYGRCSDGVPDYDAAFRYFEIAALNNVDEAIYKLGDMFRHGYGCRKSERTAWELYSRAYDENLDAFLQGKNASFADAALRMGLVFSEGINASIDCELALEFLLEAEYAAKIRVKESDFFGYAKVVANVEKKLAEVRDQLPDDFFQDEVGYYYPRFFDSLASDNHRCELARYASAEGRVALVVKRIPTRSVPHPKAILVAVPELAFCERISSLSRSTKTQRSGSKTTQFAFATTSANSIIPTDAIIFITTTNSSRGQNQSAIIFTAQKMRRTVPSTDSPSSASPPTAKRTTISATTPPSSRATASSSKATTAKKRLKSSKRRPAANRNSSCRLRDIRTSSAKREDKTATRRFYHAWGYLRKVVPTFALVERVTDILKGNPRMSDDEAQAFVEGVRLVSAELMF